MTPRPARWVDDSAADADRALPSAVQDPGRTGDALRLMDQIIQRSPIGVAVIDHDGVFRSVNPSFCQMHGYRQEELLGRRFTLLLPHAEHNRVMALHRDFLDRSAEMDGERVVLRRDGSMLNVIAHSVRVPGDEGRWRRLVYVVDITERRRMESALQASQQFTRSVLDGLGAHVCVIDDNGVIVTVNRAWLDFAAANGGSLSSLQEGASYLRVCEIAAGASSADAAVAAQFLALFARGACWASTAFPARVSLSLARGESLVHGARVAHRGQRVTALRCVTRQRHCAEAGPGSIASSRPRPTN